MATKCTENIIPTATAKAENNQSVPGQAAAVVVETVQRTLLFSDPNDPKQTSSGDAFKLIQWNFDCSNCRKRGYRGTGSGFPVRVFEYGI